LWRIEPSARNGNGADGGSWWVFCSLVRGEREEGKAEFRVQLKTHTRKTGRCGTPLALCATLYDVVGSVKEHLGFTSREGSFFSPPIRIFSLSFISTKARCLNLAVESGSTNHLFGLPARGTMIRFSDAAITRGSKAPNQPSDGFASTRVAPGLPCLRTSCA